MSERSNIAENQLHYQEIAPKTINGMLMLVVNIMLYISSIALFIYAVNLIDSGKI